MVVKILAMKYVTISRLDKPVRSPRSGRQIVLVASLSNIPKSSSKMVASAGNSWGDGSRWWHGATKTRAATPRQGLDTTGQYVTILFCMFWVISPNCLRAVNQWEPQKVVSAFIWSKTIAVQYNRIGHKEMTPAKRISVASRYRHPPVVSDKPDARIANSSFKKF